MIRRQNWLVVPLNLVIALALPIAAPLPCGAQSQEPLGARIQKVIERPEFRHATFGIEFLSLDTGKPIFALNEDKLFTPGSTTKLLTEGAVLELLGADYRFHTRVYRTGPVEKSGTLKGDIVLVASGDPNLSNRLQPDGTLAFQNADHTVEGGSPLAKAVPGDPLFVIREIAKQIRARGITRVEGRVLVDTPLFPDGEPELGGGTIISSIVVNDNAIDLIVGPGASEGAPATLNVSPAIDGYKFVNHITTGPANSHSKLNPLAAVTNSDGTQTITLSGSFPAGLQSILLDYAVPHPTKFAEAALRQALQETGVIINSPHTTGAPDFKMFAKLYAPDNQIAEHISAPLSEEVKVTLKVSQNLHASMGPFLLGALIAHKAENIDQAGFDLEDDFLQTGGLDLSGASQGDGAGGAKCAYFSPDFMVHYLEYMSKQKDFELFRKALPILGRDGTLFEIQTESPAAGHVFAKTGTFGSYDALNRELILNGKGIAGYLTTVSGQHLAFAAYVNHVAVPLGDQDVSQPNAWIRAFRGVGDALGAIAAAAYDGQIEPASR